VSGDPLDAIVTRAAAEGVLTPERMARFTAALRERAEIILAARVLPLEERSSALEREVAWRAGQVAALEQESAWRAAQVAALEQESAWRAGQVAALEQESAWRAGQVAALEQESAWRAGQVAALEQEVAWRAGQVTALEASHQAASAAHDRLLQHHRGVIERTRSALIALSNSRPWHFGRIRKEMVRLAETLRRELG
jgi:uncharacterized protein (DUF3084 family)